MDPQSDTPTRAIPRIIRAVLADDPHLAAYFDRISVSDLPAFQMPFVVPALLIYPGEPQRERAVGGPINLVYRIAVHLVLPALTPATQDIAEPSAPTIAAGATGPLTGAYQYRLTEFGAAGESNAGAAGSLTVSAKAPTVAIPALTSGTGHRIWRSRAGKTACRWVGTVFGGSSTWIDTTPDDHLGAELAPLQLLAEGLTDAIAAALFSGEFLVEDGHAKADICFSVDSQSGGVLPKRNVWVSEIRATIGSFYDPTTGNFLTEAP